MINFAQMIAQGQLTNDPEMLTTTDGRSFCRFRMAINKRISAEKQKTSFISVTVFGPHAINCGKYLTKGRTVYVSGIFETDEYTDRDGNKRTGFGLIGREVIFGAGGKKEEETIEKKEE